jgi:hypothetical protein
MCYCVSSGEHTFGFGLHFEPEFTGIEDFLRWSKVIFIDSFKTATMLTIIKISNF